jgi:hypothetical protein
MQSEHRDSDFKNAQSTDLQLWWLPALGGILPAVAVAIGAQLSMHAELVPVCNPLLEGCLSISRAGRHGLANQLYHIGLLPGAVLQALTWLLCARWLRTSAPGSSSFAMSVLGITAGTFFVLYGSFLGVEGAAYRWLRQYGTVGYFGGTYLCMLLLLRRLWPLRGTPAVRGWHLRAMMALCVVLLALCVMNTAVAPLFVEPAKDRIENVSEWWTGAGFTVVFVVLALMWRASGFRAQLRSQAK